MDFGRTRLYCSRTGIYCRKRAEQRFQAAIESSPSGMVLTNSSGIIMFVNRETERLFGYTRKELLGKSIEILVPERFRSKHPAYREEFFHHPSTRFMGAGRDLYGVRKDGVEIPLEIGLNPIETDEGLLVLSAIVDISERKRSEAALRRTAEELQRSNQELEQFAYVASHDLQEPLRMINGFLKLLESRYNAQLDEKGRTYIEYAVQGSDRMSQLINDLLEYSRVQRKQPRQEPVDLNSAIQRAMANLQASVQESGTILSQDPLPVVQGNPTQLAQLFQNLVGNAIKFRRKGTTPQIAIKCRQQEDHWVISVQDNGIGIPPEHREKVFAIFQRLHGRKEYPGTGIGLAICKKIIEQHGGRIWVDSQQGEGSTFFFTLPKAQL
jgi:PAS domain S-box-containing protein